MLTRFRMEWLLFRKSRGSWGGLLLIGLLTALAFQVGWSRVKQQEQLHQRFLSERTDLLTVFNAAVAENSRSVEAIIPERKIRSRMMDDSPPADFEALLKRKVTPLEENQYSWMWNAAQIPSGMSSLSTSFKVWRPPTVTGAISVGELDQWPEFYVPRLSSNGISPAPSVSKTLSTTRIVNPFHVNVGTFDLATLLIVIVPLVIIVLTYDSLSHDREQGVLRMLAAQNQSVWSVMITRLALRTLGVVIVFLSVVLVCFGMTGTDFSSPTTWALLGTFSLTVIVYAIFWGCAVGGITALGCSSTTNAVLLAICWLMLVVIMPLGISQAVAGAFPVRPATALMTREKEIQKSIQDMQSQLARDAQNTHGESTPVSRAEQMARLQADARVAAAKLQESMRLEIEQFYRQHQQRSDAMRFWQSLSPAFVVKSVCDTIAGNSQDQFIQFTRKVCNDHREYLDYFAEKGNQKLTTADLEMMPCFPLESSVAGISWSSLNWSILTIALWGVGVAALGWGTFKICWSPM